METAHSRFEKWVAFTGLSDAEIARRLGCDTSYPGKIMRQGRRPGLELAHSIERLTSDWPEGPIRTEEWVDADHAPTVAPAATDRECA